MPERETLLKDKPYEFIPLLEQCRQEDYCQQQIREKCSYSGKLKLKITTQSHLHIGSGQQDYDENGNIIKRQVRRNGQIVIPGSSLKGVVRSVAEAVSYSCAVKVPDPILKTILPEGNNKACSNVKGLCMSCFIFGMMSDSGSFKGRAQFGEFVLKCGVLDKKKIPQMKSPFSNYPKEHDRFGVKYRKCNYGNERLYYCMACEAGDCGSCTKQDYYLNREVAGTGRKMGFRGRKFYSTAKELELKDVQEDNYEVIPPGSVFEGEVRFQGLREEEGKLLAYALDIGHFYNMKIGYGKPFGYGKVQVDLIGAESMPGRYPSVTGISRELIEKWAKDYREESTWDIALAIKELERIMGDAKGNRIANSY